MKKIFGIISALALAVLITSCGGAEKNESKETLKWYGYNK